MAVSEDEPLDTSAIRLDVTVPSDARFRPMLDAIASKTVAYLGYVAGDAAAVMGVVEHVTTGVLQHAGGVPYTSLALSFATGAGEMVIRVRYLVETTDAPAATGGGIEQILREPGDNGAPIDEIRRVMTRVEFGHDDGAEYCALAKTLPD